MRPDRSGCCKKLNIHTHFIKMAKSPNWPLNDIAPKEIIFGVRCALLPSFHLLRHHPRWTTNKIKFDLPFHYPGIIQSPALHPLFSQSHIQLPNGIILLLLLLPQPTLTTLVASPGICQNKHLVPVIDSSNILLRQKNIVLLLLMMIWNWIFAQLDSPLHCPVADFFQGIISSIESLPGKSDCDRDHTGRITSGYKSMARQFQFQFSTRSRVQIIKWKDNFFARIGNCWSVR